MIEKLYRADLMGEKIDDLIKSKMWTPKILSKELKKYDVLFSERQINNYISGNYESEIGAKKLLAISKIFKVSIDYLLSNKEVMIESAGVIKNEVGLDIETVKKLMEYKKNRLLKRKFGLFKDNIKLNLPEDIDEIIIINYIINKTNIIETIKYEIKDYIKQYNEIQLKIKNTREDKIFSEKHNKFQIYKLKKELRDIITEKQMNINKVMSKIFIDLSNTQINKKVKR